MARDGNIKPMMERYCQEYIKDPTKQEQAALRAGYAQASAAKRASLMMKDQRIIDRIAELMKGRSHRVKVDADYVLNRLVDIDQMDVLDIIKDDGSLRPISEWPKVWRTTLSAFDISTIITNFDEANAEHILKKVKWPDKVKNLELMGKHVNVAAFRERVQVDVSFSLADKMAAARQRVAARNKK
ncbi:terminase small subunit [Yersinia intermedia]|uniref:terminase small subunit n=1 Tax=Yersinia intermedia TaxID=631 RepID=UPI0022FE37C0|nr:terminase small subunit [Yersinia intermedia]MDA5510522.1 terminase small subunit [Yersinia intermedia]